MSSDGLFPMRRDLLDQANAEVVLACESLDAPAMTLTNVAGDVSVYRSDSARPRAFWVCGAQELSRSEVTEALRQGRYDQDGRLVPRHAANIRWAPGVTDTDRRAREQQYRLREGVQQEGRTWRYILGDVSEENSVALITDQAVEDTSGLDRRTGALVERPVVAPGGPIELLIGTEDCRDRGQVSVLARDQADGRVTLDVDAPVPGLVFLSEPFYPERLAFVDGREAPTHKANLAFTAVPVPAGRHSVELRVTPRSFYYGLGVSGVTLIAWIGLLYRGL
jgi:hypothetical protein